MSKKVNTPSKKPFIALKYNLKNIAHKHEVGQTSSKDDKENNVANLNNCVSVTNEGCDRKIDPLLDPTVLLEKLKISQITNKKQPDPIVSEEMDDDMANITPRKSVRIKLKPTKYKGFIESLPQKRLGNNSSDNLSEDEEILEENVNSKPTALFTNDDVEGQDMFKFKSRHSKLDLQNKVKTAIQNSPANQKSPLTTPKRSRFSNVKPSPMRKVFEDTPKNVNEIIKKRLAKQLDSESDEDSDFSAGSSDFVPEGSENESSSSKFGVDSDDDEPLSNKRQELIKRTDRKTKQKDSEYIVAPDNYFMMHSSKKITTSDHTLERLKNLNLIETINQDMIQVSEEHKNCMNKLNKTYERLFNRWCYVLSENFNIILYGVGSKRSIVHQFQEKKLQDYPCIVINGFFPGLTMKSILEAIIVDCLEYNHVPSNIGDVVTVIDNGLKENGLELFLIIHNIDGTTLRNSKAQSTLASLSQIKNVHTIATIDHINAPLLWDHSKLSKFNFTWWDVTTFMPYSEETSFENSLMAQRTGAHQLSSLRSVYQSLTSNAKGIFNIIIQHQLDNYKQAHYQGLPFRELYSKSREHFLVSSDVALRAQLTEFLDHKLVKMKRTFDGSENLVIPIDNTLLQQFLDQQSAL